MHENIIKRLEEADKSEGYFITITIRKGDQLTHYQRQKGFYKQDTIPSLEELKKLVTEGMT